MPYSIQPLTPELVLSRMTPGRTYVTHRLAERLHVKSTVLRGMLATMVAEGRLGRIKTSTTKNAQFFVAGTLADPPAETSAADVDPARIAGRRAPPPLDRTIRGYDAEIAERVALCMLARGRR